LVASGADAAALACLDLHVDAGLPLGQISTCAPNSMTRLGGILK
jgi:hypothetical protein